MADRAKRKQKPKAGRVVRLTPDLVTIVNTEQEPGETIPDVIRRLFGLKGEVRYVLPYDLHETAADARGQAVLRGERKSIPRPIPVRKA